MFDISKIRSALVVGLSLRTGLSAANYLAGRNIETAASDVKTRADLAGVMEKLDPRVRVIAGPQEPSILDRGFDLVVLSPGVPQTIPLVAEAVRRGVPVIAEVELAYLALQGTIIGITGTDGKTTTTALTGHLLAALGFDALVGGNIGVPLISFAGWAGPDTVTVAELSSFQLETIREFRPRVAAILNVTPDHLDRYGSMEEYLDAKLRIAVNQTGEDYFVANGDDSRVIASSKRVKSRVLTFSIKDTGADAFYNGGSIICRHGGSAIVAAEALKMKIFGIHNIQNAMAAILMASAMCDIAGREPDFDVMAGSLYGFRGLEHRMELLGEYQDRTFINDSKATTVGAVEMAVHGYSGNCVLILGGRTKGDDYSRLVAGLRGRVRGLILIGESSGEFSEIFSEFRMEKAETMDDAVARGMRMSEPGDAVLLSPVCASFDMFENFEERGKAFRAGFDKLRAGELRWT